jgi:hypothetical protein
LIVKVGGQSFKGAKLVSPCISIFRKPFVWLFIDTASHEPNESLQDSNGESG